MFGNLNNNRTKAVAAWGADAPAWVLVLADACDRTSQRGVADQLGKSSGYISRLINHSYAGSYPEAEQLVRATLADEDVVCPAYGQMPLKTCIRNRRREKPVNWLHVQFARVCPTCPNNTDRPHEQED
ncbi:hypothetical protein I6G65_15995 [Sphingomonas paucimobilis]|uniref:DNA, contig: SP630 n=1 Tax=Sphingomonas paucimobilis NBRC 13935 TaxID=1219050 RepID=A0A0C9NCW2_SPHPI|nr:hypothetical protein [Sphingomonas paucimobilis]QPS15792.1 hypothetical protein I6G65_15995 [Sphingomonas paucimobilis]GAN14137.1 hypothetical protein SP6_30_02780 [Sphingomonas paucimobilis NBRC 13935]SUJ08224.1 Uncharacterised protein [Sphingomonas paucimobilis]